MSARRGPLELGLYRRGQTRARFYEHTCNKVLIDVFVDVLLILVSAGSEGVMYHERQLMVYELYIATISAVVAAIFFGIISAMLAIINTGSNPVEAICHVPGQREIEKKIAG